MLVRETLPLVDRPYVEAMAVMAKYNPFFEKAEMTKVTVREPEKEIQKGVEGLEKLGFKPYLLASTQSNLEQLKTLSPEKKVEVKMILANVGYYKRLRATNKPFISKKDFCEWLKTQNLMIVAQVTSRLAVLAETKVYLFWVSPLLSGPGATARGMLAQLSSFV
jgi:hypothetical protein